MAGSREGAWCHIEIPSAQPESAKRFYGNVFGWTFTDVPALNYTLYSAGEGEIGGGLWNPAAGVPRQIVNYVNVSDIEATVAKVEQYGGKLVNPKMEVPNAGWFALVADPDGNVVGLWKNLKPPAAPAKSKAKPAKRKAKPAKKAAKKKNKKR